MLYKVTLVLLLCGAICEISCNTVSEKRDVDVETRVTGLEERFGKMENDIQSINQAVSELLSVLQEGAPSGSEESHIVKRRTVISSGNGLAGLPDALLGNTGGDVYTRWGRTTCGSDSTLLYKGYAAVSRFDEPGGGVNYQCMPMDPEYSRSSPQFEGSWMVGVEYQTYLSKGVFPSSAHDQNAPCARCYTNNRPAVMMIPAKRNCAEGWTKEYEGYLMTDRNLHNHQTTFECVDASPEYIAGEGSDTNGGLFYFIKTFCHSGGHCPPYDMAKEMTCVVCSK